MRDVCLSVLQTSEGRFCTCMMFRCTSLWLIWCGTYGVGRQTAACRPANDPLPGPRGQPAPPRGPAVLFPAAAGSSGACRLQVAVITAALGQGPAGGLFYVPTDGVSWMDVCLEQPVPGSHRAAVLCERSSPVWVSGELNGVCLHLLQNRGAALYELQCSALPAPGPHCTYLTGCLSS